MIAEKKKYIIELPENTHWIQWIMEGTKDHHPYMDYKQVEDLMPYTEPDLEQVKKDYDAFYEHGYEQGLADAWDAARKISSMDSPTRDEVFGLVITSNIFDENTASEAIEKIRQYEQEKEEIKVGNEVKSGDEKYIVLQKYLNNIDELMVVLFNRRNGEIDTWHMYNANGAIFEKTGRHFQEIAEVLRKMKES